MTQINNPLEELFEQTGCAIGVQKRGDNCFTEENAKKIIEHFTKENINVNKNNLAKKLKEQTKCPDDDCLYKSGYLENIIGYDKAKEHEIYQLKPDGPKDDPNKWLSNHNIDDILEQHTRTFEKNNFHYIKFQMSDFDKNDTELNKIDLIKKYNDEGMRTFAVVLNDDVSTGGGTHWTAIFCDFRNKNNVTIEHFNSSGVGIMPSFNKWMIDTKTKFEKEKDFTVKLIYADNIEHQKDNASCGPYSLYYITSRLKNISYELFMDQQNTIQDKVMWEFRKVLFK
jgi:hypothetical protein